MRIIKRLAAPRWWPIERKVKKFIVSPRGSYPREMSIPLLVLIRDVLKVVETGEEAKSVISRGEIMIDGRKRKDPHYGIGLFDTIEIPSLGKTWRATPKRGLEFVEIPKNEAHLKICRIMDKKTLKGNKTQLNLHDGKNILADKNYSTNDSLLIEMPKLKIVDHFKFEKGASAIVTGGKNSGKLAKIKEIEKDRVWMEDKEKFEVPKKLVMVVGKDKPPIKIE